MDIIISMSSSCLSYLFYNAISKEDLVYHYINNFGKDFLFLSVIALLQIFFNYTFDLYRSYRSTRFRKECVNVLKANLFFCIIQIAVVLFTQTLSTFQVMILGYYILNTCTAIIYRAFLRSVLKYMRSHGYNKKYIAIIGINNCTERFIEKIQTSADLGFELSGYFASAPDTKIKAAYLGNYKKITEFYRNSPPDEAVIMLSDQLQPSLDHLIAICENWGIKFSILPNMFSSLSSRIYISSFDGIPGGYLETTENDWEERYYDYVWDTTNARTEAIAKQAGFTLVKEDHPPILPYADLQTDRSLEQISDAMIELGHLVKSADVHHQYDNCELWAKHYNSERGFWMTFAVYRFKDDVTDTYDQ